MRTLRFAFYLSSIALYSWLFYLQSAGINFMIFSLVLVIFQLLFDPSLLKDKYWGVSATATIVTGVCVFMYGNLLSVFTNLFSLMLCAIYSLPQKMTLIFTTLQSIANIFVAPYYMFEDYIKQKSKSNYSFFNIVLLSLIPVSITLIFFALYYNANPLLRELVEKIDLSFINFTLILFTISGAWLLYAFFKPQKNESLYQEEQRYPNQVNPEKFAPESFATKSFEYKTAIILFVLLNGLLLLVNILDCVLLFSGNGMLEIMNRADLVHHGVYTLIVSIVLAIGVILWFFRGELNFHQNKIIHTLAYVWILLNSFLLFTAIIKNWIYISDFGLTYKRIGVYIWLTLTIAGLITTTIKILYTKTNWYLFKLNTWIAYTFLTLCCLVNWDRLIVNYNLYVCRNKPDVAYMTTLSKSVMPDLFMYIVKNPDQNSGSFYKMCQIFKYEYIESKEDRWPSYCLDTERVNTFYEENLKEKTHNVNETLYEETSR